MTDRSGDICNACVLLVKRWKKLPRGSKKNWNHVSVATVGSLEDFSDTRVELTFCHYVKVQLRDFEVTYVHVDLAWYSSIKLKYRWMFYTACSPCTFSQLRSYSKFHFVLKVLQHGALLRYGNTSMPKAVSIIACSCCYYQVVDARAGPGGGCKTSTGLRQRSIRQRDDPDLKCKKIIKKRVSPPTVSSFPPVTPEDGKIQHNVVCLNLNMNMHWKKVFQILTTNFIKLVDHFVSAETFLRCIPQWVTMTSHAGNSNCIAERA